MQFAIHDETTKQRRFRSLVLESLELRHLMASDIDVSAQDLLHKSQDPLTAASQPTANFSTFSADRLVSLDSDSLNLQQTNLINRLSGQSKNSFAPTSYLSEFRNRVPTQTELQSKLIGSSTTPKLNLDASSSNGATVFNTASNATSAEALSIADGSFFAGFFAPSAPTKNAALSRAVRPNSRQWVGAFCDINGAEVFPSDLTKFVHSAPSSPEGEGGGGSNSGGSGGDENGDEGSIVPDVDFPELVSSQYIGSLDSFLPPSPVTSSSLTTFGLFTAASLTNPDLTLPGLHWVHLVDLVWVSETQWSFSESLVLSFDLTNSESEVGDSANASGDSGEQEPDPETEGLDVDANWESTADASRDGFFKFTFSASRGTSTTNAAGVDWSLWVDYLDSAVVNAEASGGAEFTPSAETGSNGETEGSGIISDSGGSLSMGGGTAGTPSYPDDFTASAEWSASADVNVTTSGVISMSSIPSFASDNVVERSLVTSITYDVDGDIDVSEDWSSSSQSGDISFPDTPVDEGANPLLCFTDDLFIVDPDEPIDGPSPMGDVEGTGHASMSGGQSIQSVGGGLSGSFGLTGVLRGGRFSSLAGNALSELDQAKENSGGGSHKFVARDQVVTPTLHGQTTTTIVLTAGWKGLGKGDGTADNQGDIELSIGQDGAPAASNESEGEIDGDSDANGNDFIDLKLDEKTIEAWNTFTPANYGPSNSIGTLTNTTEVIYKSKSNGKTIGDANGFASALDLSADYDSDLEGKGGSVLKIQTTKDRSDKITYFNGLENVEYEQDIWDDSKEEYVSKYEITGGATGIKNDDGSVTWTIDATITNDLEVDYDSVHDYDDLEETPYVSGYHFTRIASLDGTKSTTSTITGGGTIGLLPGSDTGGITTTETSTRTGDPEVAVVVTGTSGAWLQQKSDLELAIEAIFSDDSNEYGSSGDTGNNGSGSNQGVYTGLASSTGAGTSTDPLTWSWGVGSAVFLGTAQGVCNIVNGLQNKVVDSINGLPAFQVMNAAEGIVEYASGYDLPDFKIPRPTWSRNAITVESGTPGGWDDTHGWSMWSGTDLPIMALSTAGSLAASAAKQAANAGLAASKTVADDVAGAVARAPVRGPLAGLLDSHAAGQGFTGVFDSVTGQVLLRPSRVFAAGESIPAGWVARRGGHDAVSTLLGGSRANHLGYAVITQADGSLAITWSSGVLNGGPGAFVPLAMRQRIIDAIQAATGRVVSSF